MIVGIDKLGMATPNQYLDLRELAQARQVDPNKFLIGIGQKQMAVPGLDQDIVALAANAAEQILTVADRRQIGLLIVATESGVDQSKAAALFVHKLLGLTEQVRAIEIKEACYGATAGLQLARDFVASHPQQKALVIASDIARYGLETAGEVTQGAGAVAMLVSTDPQILALETESVYQSQSVADFWRPNYSTNALAKGKYSEEVYLEMFTNLWEKAQKQGLVEKNRLAALLFHIPFSKMGRKGLRTLEDKIPESDYQRLLDRFEKSILYGQRVGNIYTGSLYLGLLSLLDQDSTLQAGDRLGFFSYGSGAVAELFLGSLQPEFRQALQPGLVTSFLDQRRQLSVAQYEQIFRQELVTDGSQQDLKATDPEQAHYLCQIRGHERFYN
ncbi:hydroxymethylglutaryl-CoA synthase [Lactobacillus sp. DCY120]|uniref:Hydroxymethylglutaryl-CoA synthase n=1 Tax=Bombilactobacillus apium TaxID=2675299 RepID=A0A850RDC1_9LACO|nr:hydroxymethylglutaryl-CoA synthase [Bombilactobacillus apium]NVY96758.1 hydroxymethylglutaryl-CoA synthase [Bombilactobacillus apium]